MGVQDCKSAVNERSVTVYNDSQQQFTFIKWKSQMFKNRAVMRFYLDLANNAYIADANFHYTECGMAKLLQEYCQWNP